MTLPSRVWRSTPTAPAGDSGSASSPPRSSVGDGEDVHDLAGNPHPLRGVEALADRLAEALPLDQLEDEHVGVVLLDEVVDPADAGGLGLGAEAGLPQEARLGLRVQAVLAANGLQGHPSAALFVVA